MKLGLMFTGQGSESLGMGLDLIENNAFIKERFIAAESILGYNPIALLQDESTFSDTSKIQPLTFLFQSAIVDYLKSVGIESSVTFGLSLGEYAALYDANVFGFEAGLEILMNRGKFMQENVQNTPGKMCAFIGLKADALETVIEQIDDVYIANYNTPKQLVVSGKEEAIEKAVEKAKEEGLKRAIYLETVGAFHSPYMLEASNNFGTFLESVELEQPTKDVYVNVTGDKLTGSLKDNMVNQITSPVRFYQMVEKLNDIDLLVEIGPKNVLCNLVKRIDRSIKTKLINDNNSLKEGLEVFESEF